MIGAALAMRATRRSFAALNRGDLATFMSGVSDDAVFEFPGRTVVSGSHRGADAIRSWYGAWFSQMPSRRFTIKKIAAENGLAMGSSNSVLVEWLWMRKTVREDGSGSTGSPRSRFDMVESSSSATT
ncbi:MAG: nuclear transport factor 2 family protein [Acidimicrobiia bacterium]